MFRYSWRDYPEFAAGQEEGWGSINSIKYFIVSINLALKL